MKFAIFFPLTMISLSTSAAYTGKNRIKEDKNPAARCMGGVDRTTCESRRMYALNKGCVTREEYDTLKRVGSYPICSNFGENTDLELQSWCPCGCFHPDTAISVETNGSKNSIENALEISLDQQNFRIVHLAPNATMSDFALTSTPIKFATSGPEPEPLIVIETNDASLVKLTTKHPVLTASGQMVLAKELKIDDGLIDQDGSKVEILSISNEMYEGNVVNFMIDEPIESRLEHVIFANRIAVGDLAWQSSLEDELNQIIIRQ